MYLYKRYMQSFLIYYVTQFLSEMFPFCLANQKKVIIGMKKNNVLLSLHFERIHCQALQTTAFCPTSTHLLLVLVTQNTCFSIHKQT